VSTLARGGCTRRGEPLSPIAPRKWRNSHVRSTAVN
jgi:hypothetical protein